MYIGNRNQSIKHLLPSAASNNLSYSCWLRGSDGFIVITGLFEGCEIGSYIYPIMLLCFLLFVISLCISSNQPPPLEQMLIIPLSFSKMRKYKGRSVIP